MNEIMIIIEITILKYELYIYLYITQVSLLKGATCGTYGLICHTLFPFSIWTIL